MVAFIVFFLMKTKVLLQTNTIEKKKLPDRISANLEEYVIRKEMMKVKKRGKKKITEFNKRLVTNRKSLAVFYSG